MGTWWCVIFGILEFRQELDAQAAAVFRKFGFHTNALQALAIKGANNLDYGVISFFVAGGYIHAEVKKRQLAAMAASHEHLHVAGREEPGISLWRAKGVLLYK